MQAAVATFKFPVVPLAAAEMRSSILHQAIITPGKLSSERVSDSADSNSRSRSPVASEENSPSAMPDLTCTICGDVSPDRPAFNAHIKIHLKEKLKNRRAQRIKQGEGASGAEVPFPRNAVPSKIKPPLSTHSELMAELAACKPVPPTSQSIALSPPPSVAPKPPFSINPYAPIENICTPEVSEMDETLSNGYDANRVDLNSDLTSILEQIETDLEPSSVVGLKDISLDTPPDSDSENSDYLAGILNSLDSPTPTLGDGKSLAIAHDLLGLDAFSSRLDLPSDDPHQTLSSAKIETSRNIPPQRHPTIASSPSPSLSSSSFALPSPPSGLAASGRLELAPSLAPRRLISTSSSSHAAAIAQAHVQRPQVAQQVMTSAPSPQGGLVQQSAASVAKVGQLPANALAVLGQLPSNLFLPQTGSPNTKLVNVVKVERSNLPQSEKSETVPLLSAAAIKDKPGPFTIINIECHERGKNGELSSKVIERYRAIDTGSEIKLIVGNNADIAQTARLQNSLQNSLNAAKAAVSTAATSRQHAVAAAAGKPAQEKTHKCPHCHRRFQQRSHLYRHERAQHGHVEELTCEVCKRQCKNKISLARHRSKHPCCMHCAETFEHRAALQEHLLLRHPDAAVLSVERPKKTAAAQPTLASASMTKTSNLLLNTNQTLNLAPKCRDSFLIGSAASSIDELMMDMSSPAGSLSGSSISDGSLFRDEAEDAGLAAIHGQSLADISDSNFFGFASDLDEEMRSSDLF